ncbi:uncharacterized protein LOC118179468 [Stegodyphus dumicola]|uniref:uncharacterized protein LOC118179468 n=1 Tax=Stegodyphus dumicola TaxID=202533 RepID=UPI0015ADC0BE|nr:uncharacterized protein LOC118179468 [Stegodyphus dumicola]
MGNEQTTPTPHLPYSNREDCSIRSSRMGRTNDKKKAKKASYNPAPFLLNYTGSYRTKSNAALFQIANSSSLFIRAEQEFHKTTVLQLRKKSHYKSLELLAKNYETPAHPYEHHPEKKNNITLSMKKEVSQKKFPQLFTDGSGLEEGKGSAIKIYLDPNSTTEQKFHLDQQNSVFQAELVALLEAIKYSITNSLKAAHIFTDSLSAMYAIANPCHRSNLIQEITERTSASQNQHFFVTWLKTHAGTKGNEEADILAKEATRGQNAQNLSVPWPSPHLKKS